jgi:cytochrome c biogenesis factor
MQKAEQMRALSTFQTLRFETYNAPDDQDVIFVDLSTKPFIWLVWLGTLLYSAGGLVAYRRRAAEAGEPDKAVA